jgi:hypothetical protein
MMTAHTTTLRSPLATYMHDYFRVSNTQLFDYLGYAVEEWQDIMLARSPGEHAQACHTRVCACGHEYDHAQAWGKLNQLRLIQ